MALEPTLTDPCSLLNSDATRGYPTLFIKSGVADATAYPLIAVGGTPKTYLTSLTDSGMDLTKDILATPDSGSKRRLVQFLSDGGVGSVDIANNYSKLGVVALSTGLSSKTYKTIVDSYITGGGLNKSGYSYATTAAPLISNAEFWNPTDASTNGGIVASPASILGKLIKDGFLLSQSDIYQPSQLRSGATVSPSSESLVYLYQLQQNSGNLSSTQTTRKNTLEATNLRFFGAFMAEYCYYRTRYEWLLQKYFEIYFMPPSTSTTLPKYNTSQTIPVAALFGTGYALPSTSTSVSLNQADYLKGLAYHMACLNTRITDMRRLLSQINVYYNEVFTLIQSDVNSSSISGGNAALTTTITALQESSAKAGKYMSEADFAKEAMNYNSEKNRYSNILLGLYAFLNIAALATVFQLARN